MSQLAETQRRRVYALYKSACAWCGRTQELEIHHRERKGMGGRHNEWLVVADSLKNLVLLCRTCHAAAHGETSISLDGHSCAECPHRWACEFNRGPSVAPTREGAEGYTLSELLEGV